MSKPAWVPSTWKNVERMPSNTYFHCRNCGMRAVWFLEKQLGAMSHVHKSTFICETPKCVKWFLMECAR